MQLIDKQELIDALYNAAVPCINKFFHEHESETFFGFAIEILAEEGYFHVGASSIESFQPTIESYTQSGESVDEIMGEEIKWNNQEWAYFDLNYDCDIWSKFWQPTLEKITNYKEYICTLSDEDCESAQEKFNILFKSAGEEAYNKIIESGVINNIKKTPDFRAFVFEHHDVF